MVMQAATSCAAVRADEATVRHELEGNLCLAAPAQGIVDTIIDYAPSSRASAMKQG